MTENNKSHLWITDGEVQNIENKPTSRSKDLGRDVASHGAKLSSGLQEILKTHTQSIDDSLQDEDLVVFKVELPEQEKLSNEQHQTFMQKEGIRLNFVKNDHQAIVSTTKKNFERLSNRVETYKTKGKIKKFQYIDSFSVVTAEEKQSASLRDQLVKSTSSSQDVQLMLIPQIDEYTRDRIINNIKNKLKNCKEFTSYLLSDGTGIIRTSISISQIKEISKDSAVCKVELTRFFEVFNSSISPTKFELELNKSVSVENLPIVAVLDSGINFPKNMECLIVDRWKGGISNPDMIHGTQVASKVVFGNIGEQIGSPLVPRARVIDCPIINDKTAENLIIQRVQSAVKTYSNYSSIFNLSVNSLLPIEGDEISIFGYELDILTLKYGVKFVISAGNHELFRTNDNMEDILDDSDSRIAAPADSMLNITVGAVSGTEFPQAISRMNMVTSYSRIGPGFNGFRKPDLVAYGATLSNSTVLPDKYAAILMKDGNIGQNAGTSFTAPKVAGDLAEILSSLPSKNILLAQTLLYHGAIKLYEEEKMTEEEAFFNGNLFGRGLSCVEQSIFSNNNKVTFVRTGEINRLTKQRVKFYLPNILNGTSKKDKVKISVTCIADAPVDRTKGSDYLGAYIRASLHKIDTKGKNVCANPSIKEGRIKWDTCYHFENVFSAFNAGDWEIWLELFSRWSVSNNMNIKYAIAITVEDLSKKYDIYNEIINEVSNRFIPINTIKPEIKVNN